MCAKMVNCLKTSSATTGSNRAKENVRVLMINYPSAEIHFIFQNYKSGIQRPKKSIYMQTVRLSSELSKT